MMVWSEQASGPCDQCGKGEAKVGAIVQGATGRYCEVMWFCEPCGIKVAKGKENIKTAEEARLICAADPNGYPDF